MVARVYYKIIKPFFLTLLLLLNGELVFAMGASEVERYDSDTLGRGSVGLVLSGGGAKGFTHLGVIKALEENGIPIDYISGTSMGAIIGGLYACGYSVEQMCDIFKSKNFYKWASGEPENLFAKHYYNTNRHPHLVVARIGKEQRNSNDTSRVWKFMLGNSLITSYPMDVAVGELFTSANKVAEFNFDSLMVPFFCISSDINNKRQHIMREGNLGSAIRASMAIPAAFSPVSLDSLVLYDGGLYNNFPWKEMRALHSPDVIIGSKCVAENERVDERNIISLINGVTSAATDYKIPAEVGFLIDPPSHDYSLFDWESIDVLIEMGYKATMEQIDSIRERVGGGVAPEQFRTRREKFRQRCKPVIYSHDIEIEGNTSRETNRFIRHTIRNNERKNFGIEQLKRQYYKINEIGVTSRLYPSYITQSDSLHPNVAADSLVYLKFKAIKGAPFSIGLGAHISSSSVNQAYVSLSYLHAGAAPWRIGLNANIGKLYRGLALRYRQDIGVHPLSYFYADAVGQIFDYFNGNQSLVRLNKLPKNVSFRDLYGKLGFALPLSSNRNIRLELSSTAGWIEQRSYSEDIVASHQVADAGTVFFLSPSLSLKEQTLNYIMFPTEGANSSVTLRYFNFSEGLRPGSTSPDAPRIRRERHNLVGFRLKSERYYSLGKHFSLGFNIDISTLQRANMSNYYSELMVTPAYEPVRHNSTLLMENFRSNTYFAGGISPIVKFTKSLYIHSTFALYKPYREIIREENGWQYSYSDKFPKNRMIGNVAIVWQTPIGPLSFSTTYYSCGAYRWYPQVNFGFLIFNKKALE